MFWPCETRTSTCRSFATISSGLYRFLAITVLLDVKDIPQVGPLQWGCITRIFLQILQSNNQFPYRRRSASGRLAACHIVTVPANRLPAPWAGASLKKIAANGALSTAARTVRKTRRAIAFSNQSA